jgi:hypothetical protein
MQLIGKLMNDFSKVLRKVQFCAQRQYVCQRAAGIPEFIICAPIGCYANDKIRLSAQALQ